MSGTGDTTSNEIDYWFAHIKDGTEKGGKSGAAGDEAPYKTKLDVSMLLERGTQEYERRVAKHLKQTQDYFSQRVMTHGTLGDKITAQSIAVRNNPFLSLTPLRQLLKSSSKKNKKEAQLAAAALQEVFCSGLLCPEDRHLVDFRKRALRFRGDPPSDRQLSIWYFEDQLKTVYSMFVEILTEGSHDTLQHFREFCLKSLRLLLVSVPEGEQQVLDSLVNGLGDTTRKVASKVAHLLGCVLDDHPAMKEVVVDSVRRFVIRPNLPMRAAYYAFTFLNQVVFLQSDQSLAQSLVNVYLSAFHTLVTNSINSKLLGALLTGITRALPYCSDEQRSATMEQHMPALFKVASQAPFNKAVQTLALISKGATAADQSADRLYRFVYELMFSDELPSSRKQAMFLNLVHSLVRKDSEVGRQIAMMKRLLQVCLCGKPPLICGSLLVVSEALRSSSALRKSAAHWRPGAGSRYNMRHGDPLKCGAEDALLFELCALATHCHPSVRLFANTLLEGKPITYTGDPLEDFSLNSFLGRLSFKEPKSKAPRELPAHEAKHAPSRFSFATQAPALNNRQSQQEQRIEETYITKYLDAKRAREEDDEEEDQQEPEFVEFEDGDIDDEELEAGLFGEDGMEDDMEDDEMDYLEQHQFDDEEFDEEEDDEEVWEGFADPQTLRVLLEEAGEAKQEYSKKSKKPKKRARK